MMSRTIAIFFLILFLGTAAQAQNAAKPVVRIEVEPRSIMLGQSVRLRVTALTPTWFLKPPEFPSFELPNALTRLPPNSSFPTTQKVKGDNWSGIVREYQIFPQAEGGYRLNPEKIIITYADSRTRKPVRLEVAVPQMAFRAAVPPAAKSLTPFIAAAKLTLKQSLDGVGKPPRVGDAIVRRIEATIEGVPAMFMPPMITARQVQGFTAYAKDPSLSDKWSGRGELLTGSRTETVTYVIEKPGSYALPPVTIKWWDTKEKAIIETEVPGLTFQIAGSATSKPDKEVAATTIPWRQINAFALAMVLIAGLARWLGPKAHRAARRWRDIQIASESYAFRKLRRSLKSENPTQVNRDLSRWLNRLLPNLSIGELSRVVSTPGLEAHYNQFARQQFGRGKDDIAISSDATAFLKVLKVARTRYLTGHKKYQAQVLPALNPSSLTVV
jgi:hypothetical protein